MDCVNVVKTTIEQLGGLDIVVSNAVRLERPAERNVANTVR